MSVYTTPASSRHNSYMRQQSAYSSRQGSAQSGFLSYSASHRNVVPPRPLSLRPISQATSIAMSDSDYESHSDMTRERGRSMVAGSKGWRHNDIKEEDEGPGPIPEEVSDAESMESLSSRARHMQGILTDSDSMHSGSRTRTSISSFSASEAATPEQSPLPHYGEPAIYDPDHKGPMMQYRHSMSYGEDLPRYTAKENMITTIGPKGPHLFRSLSVCSSIPSAAATRLASTADFIPPTPVTPLDVTEFDIPASLNTAMYDQRRLSLQFSPASPQAVQQHQSFELVQDMERSFNPERDIRPLSTLSAAVINDYDQLDIMDWTPQQVCQHLAKVGFDRTIVEKFARNDISGQILVDLKWEDLKELDIQSFGKRIEVWSEIHHLRCRSSSGPIEQFASYRPDSRMSRTASHRSGRPSPASSRPALTPRTPHVEALKPVAFSADIQEEDEEDQPRSVSSEDEETTIAVRLMRNPTRRRRVRTKKGTHARISKKRVTSTDSGTDAAETTEGEQVFRMNKMREAMPTLREAPMRRQNPAPDSIVPGDSISVAGRRTCKAHSKCTKGDKCGKHGVGSKNPSRITQLQLQNSSLPQRSTSNAGTILIATTPSIAQAMTLDYNGPRNSVVSQNDTTRPGSMVAPSVLASSDVLGPIQSREVKLQEGALREIIAMDPAENVKKFLIHQHLQHLEEQRKEPPPVPQKSNEEILRALASPGVVKPQEYYEEDPEAGYDTEQDDQVPEIASIMHPTEERLEAPPMCPPVNRSRTPALGLRTANITPAPPGSAGFSPMSYRARGSMLRTTTPFSEMDVPIGSSTPMIPEFRNQSASVPPDMSYGVGQRGFANRSSFGMPSTVGKLMAPAPPPPAAAGAGISRRGAQSTTGVRPQVVVLDDLEEKEGEWEDASDKTSIQEVHGQQKPSNELLNSSIRVHSGWMRKRKNNWFRHEWPEHHFVLRGTRLGIHKDQYSAEDGFIEMEDYSVACSNSASTKLSAAFKSWKIKNDQGSTNDGAFFFQLVPCNDKDKRGKGGASGSKEKKVVHHFAVKSRDERIDWMRELMLAKAIKQKGEGYDVEVNGEKV